MTRACAMRQRRSLDVCSAVWRVDQVMSKEDEAFQVLWTNDPSDSDIY